MVVVAKDADADARNIYLVIGAAAAGSIFEWYDFFIYGAILTVISKQFFGGVNDTAAYVFALLGFGAGFIARPFGALLFGHIGDRLGRKYAFLLTISLMGIGTFSIGLLPNYAQAGILAPVLLIAMRLLQGFAVGGEYGGAVVYVAEHAPHNKRGLFTGWLQATPSISLISALGVVLITRNILGEDAFAQWGWRVPFLLSVGLLAISFWVRMRLRESPVFERLREEDAVSKNPISESFMRWCNLKFVLIAVAGFMAAHAVIWYSAHFYTQVFLERVLKVDGATVSEVLLVAVAISAPMYVFFAWISDFVGRKPLMVTAIVLSAFLFFPLFHALAEAANPALVAAQTKSPVTVIADPEQCALQFDPVGTEQFASSCDIAKSALAVSGVSYRNIAAPPGTLAEVRIGDAIVQSVEGRQLSKPDLAAAKAEIGAKLKAALIAAGYPEKADPARVDKLRIIGILTVFMVLATMLYGPLAAALVELFPTNIRYTALSVPYHIGNGWFGGFLPAVAVATVAATGDIYSGLWYPVIVAGVSVVFALVFLPETSKRNIEKL